MTRMFALTRIIAAIEGSEEEGLSALINAGLTPDMAERLRAMPMGEAYRFVMGHCGLAIAIDAGEMSAQFMRLERHKSDREALEYMVRNGASPRLLTQLFTITPTAARQFRKALAPNIAAGGRPRVPTDHQCREIEGAWKRLLGEESCMRARIRRLHECFSSLPIASLELVILPQPSMQLVN